jgi:hypothetical protein
MPESRSVSGIHAADGQISLAKPLNSRYVGPGTLCRRRARRKRAGMAEAQLMTTIIKEPENGSYNHS